VIEERANVEQVVDIEAECFQISGQQSGAIDVAWMMWKWGTPALRSVSLAALRATLLKSAPTIMRGC
jgi:hypothetical protein